MQKLEKERLEVDEEEWPSRTRATTSSLVEQANRNDNRTDGRWRQFWQSLCVCLGASTMNNERRKD